MCYIARGVRITFGLGQRLTYSVPQSGEQLKMAELTEIPKDVTIYDSPGQVTTYATVSGITVTAEEAVLHFAVRRQGTPNEADGTVKVFLSLPHAKRIMLVLATLLKEYEQIFGEVYPDANMRLTEEGRKRLQGNPEEDVSEPK